MATYTKKEFADLIRQKTNYLAVQIKRGKVIVNKDDKIDSGNPINAQYLEKIYGRLDIVKEKRYELSNTKPPPPAGIRPLPPPAPRAKPKKDEWDDFDEDENDEAATPLSDMLSTTDLNKLTYPDLEKIYKFRQGEMLKRNTEKIEIDIAKKRGEVIPSDLLPAVIVQHNQSFITSFREVVDQILTDYGQIKDFNTDEIADMRARLIEAINHGSEKATKMTIAAIAGIVKDYTEKRGIGQRL